MEVVDDSENYIEIGNSFPAESSTADNRNVISFNVPPIDRFMDNESEKDLLNTLMNLLDAYDKWAMKISKQIKSLTSMEEKINAMNATQSLVDAYCAKDANMNAHTATSNPDESALSSLLKPKKKTYLTTEVPMPPLLAFGVRGPQQGTSRETMTPQTIQSRPITLPNVMQKRNEENRMNE